MEKAISTALFVIAAVIASMALINAVVPALGRSSSALVVANAAAAERVKTDPRIVFAAGDPAANTVTAWVKNVGSYTIPVIDQSDIFLISSGSTKRIQWASAGDCTGLIAGGTECWEYAFEGDAASWSRGKTIKVTLRLNTIDTGVNTVRMAVPNGIVAEQEFSV